MSEPFLWHVGGCKNEWIKLEVRTPTHLEFTAKWKKSFHSKGGGMLRFWNVLVLVLVLNFESFFCDLFASVGLVNKNGCKGQH